MPPRDRFRIFMTGAADRDVDALDMADLVGFSLARLELKADPTASNPRVTDASDLVGYDAGHFVMIAEGLTIEYRFLDESSLVILSVDKRSLLPERAG